MTGLAVSDTGLSESTVQLAAAGDEAAFARLVTAYDAAMARVAYVVTGDKDLTRDAVQAAWTIAWRRLDSLRDPSQVRAWLVAIAANQARSAMRHRRRYAVTDISSALREMNPGADPADAITALDVRRALAMLGPDDRALVALRYIAGLDSVEIAQYMGISASGVRSRLSRVIGRLRAEIDHD